MFPVKEEHKNPCSYLRYGYTNLNKKAAVQNDVLREFQQEPLYKSPGPVAYITDITDPGKILTSYDKPLSKKKSFLDPSKQLQPRHSRESIFAGTFKHY